MFRSGRGTGAVTSEEALVSLIEIVEQIRDLVPSDKASWDADLVVRLAVERLWISAGNCAEEYRRASQIDPGVELWGGVGRLPQPSRPRPTR